MTELVDVVLDSEVVHFLGQVDEAGPRDDGRQHQVVDVMLTACSSKKNYSYCTLIRISKKNNRFYFNEVRDALDRLMTYLNSKFRGYLSVKGRQIIERINDVRYVI